MDYLHHYESPLGGLTIASDGKALTGLWFDGQKFFADTLDAEHEEKPLQIFTAADTWLDAYFSGTDPDLTLPLRPKGTPFRKKVWEILLTIPYGRTMTYGEIAKTLAGQMHVSKMSAQAVGGAVSHNPISIIIPCHRVIGADGSLTGYAGGLDKKMKLLALEKSGRKP